ncbi:MAG TPA: NBR1-Ig-like domain-containing protein [Pseudolysinimonas sp.]|jgi:transcriptional regulator with XRE-family HTH domain
MPRPTNPRPGRAVTAPQLFGEELRYWRARRELTPAALAAACGRDRRTITAAEEGRDIPSEALVHQLEGLLETGGMLLSRYDAVIAEKRRSRLNRAVREPSPERRQSDASLFVDETIPDGTLMEPGERFDKSWTIRNAGDVVWEGRLLTRIGIASGVGLITTPAAVPIATTRPGETVTITVPCIAHGIQGTSLAAFKMTDPQGRLLFPDRYFPGLQVQINVL